MGFCLVVPFFVKKKKQTNKKKTNKNKESETA